MSKILVIGSSNTDLIAKVKTFPVAGETITGEFFMQAMGGKGANQALAAHRAGGDVSFITCLGSDANGRNALQYYEQEGLDVSLAQVVEGVPTGTAMILVNAEGENIIVITPGANNSLLPASVSDLAEHIAKASVVMLQMEIPVETVHKVCKLAARSSTQVVLNVAPAKKIDRDILGLVDIVVVNETEIETITGGKIDMSGEEGVIEQLLAMGARTVILTLGKKGCIVSSGLLHEFIPAFEVEAVDSTAAGDTFCGALVARLSKGAAMPEAIRFATAAAAICVTRIGAQPSIPREHEVEQFCLTHTAVPGNGKLKVDGADKKMFL